MRRVVYGGAMSLDGYIAGPSGEHDWIVMDPEFDFAAMSSRFDTFLIGRKTFDTMRGMGSAGESTSAVQNFVFSRTLKQTDHPHINISANAEVTVAELRSRPGKDISLFGGGDLFRSLLNAGLVDEIGVAVVPVLLGGGVPLLPTPAVRSRLSIRKQRLYEKTGVVMLEYDIKHL